MFSLKNTLLDVAILDPVADVARSGTRYCTGGYIFQITDTKLGPLLTGPTYPDSFNVFDGQGIPDAFNLAPLRTAESDPIALILGIGLCNLVERKIVAPCQWQIEQTEAAIRFTTRHVFQEWTIELERAVTLIQRTVRSETQLRNTGTRFAPVSWFPHPFFPHCPTGQDELIKINYPVEFPDSDGYVMSSNGFISRKGWPWTGGYYQPLDQHFSGSSFMLTQRHPVLNQVTATGNYVPSFFPIWGNPSTFSWEPFYERTLAPGQNASWRLDYDF